MQGDLLGSSRLLYALARDRLLPAALGVVSERHRVPVRAIITHACFAGVLAVVGNFTALALVSGGAFCIVYAACCAAAWRLQSTDRGESKKLVNSLTVPSRNDICTSLISSSQAKLA